MNMKNKKELKQINTIFIKKYIYYFNQKAKL